MSDLSVIVPVYNAEKYLHQCVDSILNQTLKDIEIILVDDGSTDDSANICDEYASFHKNIHVIHKKNDGPYGARLIGMKNCRTKYVTFVDADDFINHEAYVHAVDSMANNIDIIMFDIYNYSEQLNIKKLDKTIFPYGIYNRDKIRKVIYPRLILDESGGNGIHPHMVTKIFKFDLLYKVLVMYKNMSQYYGDDNITTYTAVKYAKTIEFINHAYYNYRARDIGVVPPYVLADNFFDEVYWMYNHLRDTFIDEPVVMKQLDLFYIKAVNLRKKVYELSSTSTIRYMFPFDKVEKNKNIVLYGAGEVGKAYKAQISAINYCKSVLWVDKNYKKYHRHDVVSVDNIMNFVFDYIVIAVANVEVANSICEDLIGIGVSKEMFIMPTF